MRMRQARLGVCGSSSESIKHSAGASAGKPEKRSAFPAGVRLSQYWHPNEREISNLAEDNLDVLYNS